MKLEAPALYTPLLELIETAPGSCRFSPTRPHWDPVAADSLLAPTG